MLSGCVFWTECYITTILAPYGNAHHTRFQHRPLIFEHTSATWQTQALHFFLRSQEKQWQSYLKSVVMFHPMILVLIGKISLWLSPTKRIHMEANLLVHVNVPAVQNQQMLCIVCVCGLSYPACKVHAPYYIVICGLYGSTIFFHIIS